MLFDIGLGNGLRNKFAEAKAYEKHDEAQTLVSTAYYSLAVVSGLVVGIFWTVNNFINWSDIFNAPPEKATQLSLLIPIVFSFFCLQLLLKLIVSIYQADQHHSITDFIQFTGQAITLLLVWTILPSDGESLVRFAIIYTSTPVVTLLCLNTFAFNGRYKIYKPKLILFKKNAFKGLANLGVKFFIIQIAATILFSTDNFIISHLYGPSEVVPYNVAFKYFSIVTLIYTVLVSPYWSAFTVAYSKKDIFWIKQSVKKIQRIWLVIPLVLVVMIVFADHVYLSWVGPSVKITTAINFAMALYIAIVTFSTIYVQFINGVGKVKLQFFVSIIVMLINIPLSIFMAETVGLGPPGVIIATSMCLGLPALLWYVQYTKLINGLANGIWDK